MPETTAGPFPISLAHVKAPEAGPADRHRSLIELDGEHKPLGRLGEVHHGVPPGIVEDGPLADGVRMIRLEEGRNEGGAGGGGRTVEVVVTPQPPSFTPQLPSATPQPMSVTPQPPSAYPANRCRLAPGQGRGKNVKAESGTEIRPCVNVGCFSAPKRKGRKLLPPGPGGPAIGNDTKVHFMNPPTPSAAAGPPTGEGDGGRSGVPPTYMTQNDPHEALIIV